MPYSLLSLLPATLITWFALAATALCESDITVTDQKGRSIDISLVSISGESVTFRRQGIPKQFTMPISQFDSSSQELIRKNGSQLPVALPKIDPEVVVGKRRRKDDSYYLVKQEVSCTVKLTNTSHNVAVPQLAGKIVFIGKNQRNPDLLCVLSTQDFNPSMAPGATFSHEMKSFTTSYDSDNKGYGNIGGYQYIGFILILSDDSGKIVFDHTTTGSFRQAITNKPSLLKQILQYSSDTSLNEKLEPGPGEPVRIR